MSDSLWSHELQYTRLSCPSPTPGVYPNSCPLSWWCHPTISSSVVPFSSCLQSFPASGSFPKTRFFPSGGQSIGVSASASVVLMNIQDWLPLGWTSFRLDLLAVQGTLKSPLQHHSSKASDSEKVKESLSDTYWTGGLAAALLPNNQFISTWVNSVHEEQQHLMPSTIVLNMEENGCF